MASAKAAATNRGKAPTATGKPPFGGPKGKGTIPAPKVAGGKAAKPPITGKMAGLFGKKK